MCTGVEIAALAATAAGTATSAIATNQQLNKQNDIAAQSIIDQGSLKKQGINDVNQTVNTLANSNAATEAKTNQQLNAYRSALLQAQPLSASASPAVPGASKAYGAAQTASSGSAADYVNKIASSAATTQGTQLERVSEGESMANTATQLGVLGQQSAEQSYLSKLKISTTQANPWVKGLGMLLQGAGMGLGLAGAAAGTAASGGLSAAGTDAAGVAAQGSVNYAPAAAFGAGANVAPAALPGGATSLGSFGGNIWGGP
jgi:hypothetical protein